MGADLSRAINPRALVGVNETSSSGVAAVVEKYRHRVIYISEVFVEDSFNGVRDINGDIGVPYLNNVDRQPRKLFR